MPSTSKAQQKFMGLVHAYKKGEVKGSEVSNAIKKAAKSMKNKSVKDYASTEHNGLPKKVKEEGFGGQLKGKDKLKFEKARKANGEQLGYTLSDTPDVKEERDYKEEYKKYGSSTKSKKYRAELNQYNRKKGTYGNGDGKDASHKGGKIVGFEKESTNRGRAEKSRLKKESSSAYGKSIEKIANDRKLKSISKKDRGLLLKIAKLMKKANESVKEATLSKSFFSGYIVTTRNVKKAIQIVKNMKGNMTGAVKKIEKIKKGLSNDSQVMDALRQYNESVNEKTVSIGGEELLKFLMKRFKMSKSQAIASMKKHKMDMSFLKNESVNEARNTNTEWNTFEKDYGDFFKTVVKLGKVNTKLTGDKTDEKIFLTNFTKNVGKFYTLMKSWKRSQNESVNESIQLPHGMELGKLFTGHGKSFVKEESVNEDVGAETILGGIVQSIQKAGLKPKSAKLMKSGFKVSKRDKVGFVMDVEIRGFDKKEIHKMQFEVERGMLYLILNNKPVKLGKWTMGTMVTKNLKKVALTLSGQKGSPKRIA